jgi:murein DD-endopeptidase MepM/ murein hydrolase activator NlpD
MRALAFAALAALMLASCEKPIPPGEETPPPVPDPVDEPGGGGGEVEPPPPDNSPLLDESGRTFSYLPAGDLIAGSAPPEILVDETVYDDKIAFPAEHAAFLNSQVYMNGGSQAALNGKTSNQCDAENYNYPWRDDFCEKRSKNQYFCAQGGHTGVDIRPASCVKETWWATAPESGQIYDIGSYGVRLMADDGTWYQFLHLQMDALAVVAGQEVVKGQRIGKFSDVFFDSAGNPVPTTIHMHLDMKESYAPTNGDPAFIDRVNPYMTLVAAYERKLKGE